MYAWKNLKINRFYGLDLKTNPLDVKDGFSLDCENVFQDKDGVVSKRFGNAVMFASDETGTTEIDEIGTALLSGVKYYFQFSGGNFNHALSLTGAKTTITGAYTSGNVVWWAVLDEKIFFVDGVGALKFFDPLISTSAIYTSSVYARPTVAPTSGGAGGFDFGYTLEKGFSTSAPPNTHSTAESAISISVSGASTTTITVPGVTGSGTIAVGDRIRVYSKANTTVTSYKNVTPTSGAHANGTYYTDGDGGGFLLITSIAASYAIVTIAISDDQPNLYTDLGVAINKQAPTGLTGLIKHYGRLVAWKDDSVYLSKSSNPHAWPDDAANKEAFVYTVGEGDGEDFQSIVSFQESLYCLKQSQIFVFGGIGPDDSGNNAFSFRRLETNGIGCIAPKSCVVVGEDRQNVLVFLSRQGFYATNGSTPQRVGEKIETQVLGLSDANLMKSVAFYHKRDGAYVCFVGASTSRVGWFLDVRKDNENLVGWFKYTGLPVKVAFFDAVPDTSSATPINRYLFGTYTGYCAYERAEGVSSDFSDVRINYVPAASVDLLADTFTFGSNHGLTTQDPVVVRTNGTIPAGLLANTTYYAIVLSNTVIALATSTANAALGVAINLTTQGVGTHSVVGSKAISGSYTTNWINFGSTSVVKKLGKASVSFDSTANSINLDIGLFYDWFNVKNNTLSISVESNHIWGEGSWGNFSWGAGAIAIPKNLALPRRKVRSIKFKFENNVINEDFNLQSIEIPFDNIRNRGNFA